MPRTHNWHVCLNCMCRFKLKKELIEHLLISFGSNEIKSYYEDKPFCNKWEKENEKHD